MGRASRPVFDIENRIFYHGSQSSELVLRPFIHLGNHAQAAMRGRYVFAFRVKSLRLKRVVDRGKNAWDENILDRLAEQGYDGAVYLNRFEGIPLTEFQAASEKANIDALSDARFRMLIPSADWSIIVFDPYSLTLLDKTAQEMKSHG